MNRVLIFFYGLLAYGAFLFTILYAIGFVGNLVVPKSIDTGTPGPVATAVLVNVLLMGLFAVQHTIMARPAFKARWTRLIPAAAERSTFVLIASALLCLLFWQWRPLPATLWDVQQPLLRNLIWALSFTGWALVFYSSFVIDHFDLFGLRQVFLHLRRRPYTHHPFMERAIYRWVRHPLMLGFLVAFWATPTMTAGHLLFAGVITAYILLGTRIEERDLLRAHGPDYAAYRRRTPMLLPLPRRRAPRAPTPQAAA